MAEKKEPQRRLSVDEQRAQDEAQGGNEDQVMLTNDSGEVKKLSAEEWENEERQAELLKQGWKVIGGETDER